MKGTITHQASHGHVHVSPNVMQTPRHDTHSVNKTQETNLDALFNDVLICLPVTAALHGTGTLLGTLPPPHPTSCERGLISPTPSPSPLAPPHTTGMALPPPTLALAHTHTNTVLPFPKSKDNYRDVISVIIR